MLRAGTYIGANIAESRYAQSKSDFAAKLQIALTRTKEKRLPKKAAALLLYDW